VTISEIPNRKAPPGPTRSASWWKSAPGAIPWGRSGC